MNKGNIFIYSSNFFIILFFVIKILSFAILSFLSLIALGQHGQTFIKNFPPSAYYLDNLATSPLNFNIIQDNQGIIYVANSTGILEYDGYTWRMVSGTPNLQLKRLIKDSSGRILAFGVRTIGVLYKNEAGHTSFYALSNSLPENIRIHDVLMVNNEWYVLTNKNLVKIRGNSVTKMNLSNELFRLYFISNKVYLSGKNELFSLENMVIQPVHEMDDMIMNVMAIDDNLLITTNRNILIKKNTGLQAFSPELFEYTRDSEIFASALLSDGKIALGTREGLYILDKLGRVLHKYNKDSGIYNSTVASIYEDYHSGIWLGLHSGLAMIDYSSPLTYFNDNNQLSGSVSSIIRNDSLLYAGTPIGLYALNLKEEEQQFTLLNKDFIWDLVEYDGNIYASSNKGVYRISGKTAVKISEKTGVVRLKPSERNREVIYAGLTDGLELIKIQHDSLISLGRVKGFSEAVRTIEEVGKDIWVADETVARLSFTSDQLEPEIKFYGEKEGFRILPDQYKSFEVYKIRNNIYFGSNNGLYLYNSLKDRIEQDTLLGFSTNSNKHVFELAEDNNHNIWLNVGFKTGKVFVNENKRLQFDSISLSALPKTDVWAIYPDKEQTIWIGTTEGLFRFVSKNHGQSERNFSTLIRSVKLNSDSVIALSSNLHSNKTYELTFRNRNITFDFTGTSYKLNNQLNFQYFLEGYDEHWSPLSAKASKEYTNLPPGDYKFRVKSINNNGGEGAEDVFEFTILPPIYQTTYAYIFYFLIISVLIFFYDRYRTRLQKNKLRQKEKELERERIINEKLQQADKLKDEFLANTSHELRTPLNGIIGLAESLFEGVAGPVNKEMKQNLSLIVSSGKRLSSLVNSILDFAKLKNHSLDLHLKPMDIHSVADVVIRISKPLLAGKNLFLINNIPKSSPFVLADENRLQQILHNLVGNAIKFTETGFIEINASVIDQKMEIVVADTGIGIPEEKREIIFREFEQIDSSASRVYGGTGLGLAITKQLVELHGGTLRVESVEGKGSKFFFTLPLARESIIEQISGAVESPVEQPYQVDFTPNGVSKNGTFRILIVDDEPVNHQVISNYLRGDIYDVTSVMNGPDALEKIHSEKFDLVLLDIMMPRMSGFEVCKRIREKFYPNELPVIMITAKNQVSDLVEGLTFGANDYITKPFTKNEFLARLKTHLNLLKINNAYGRFVPHEFLKTLGRDFIIDVKLGDQVAGDMTILFTDIRSYTALSESMTPEENFNFINAYLSRVGPVIKENNGFVNQYYGDGIMALFVNKPEDAVRAAIGIHQQVQLYNLERIQKNRIDISVGAGIHTGPTMLGIMGDEHRMEAGVVSDTVNTASRMEGLTKYYGSSIIISEDTYRLINPEEFNTRYLGKVQLQGKNKNSKVYEIFDGEIDEVRKLKSASKTSFERGLKLYYKKSFSTAAIAFEEVLKHNPSDKAAQRFLRHSANLMVNGVPEEWSGVIEMETK